ncbi:DNA polymerase I [Patescibacteria group bacterium]|nr:DNA polymerase I [Candidatus Falkowbacteria bacterium]MBU3905555.1 DNA polymerase I [Patescibacteria group bacterium]MBU4015667.1 DNA polymerase I [Patescibacteria group bacterium]MBU4026239.1 DNA polymerase I [Patescibacteria group bacterium]MBU4073104.1 DNA polymerase I [Patescibacteria group bacterium]
MEKENKKTKHKKSKLMIIDGNALIHRSFHALPPTMATKTGEMTNAVYGFTTVLIKAMREFKPDYIALTLDRAAPTFRHKEYKEYKANRVKAPDDLYNQFPRVREVAKVFNIPIYEKDGFEADDLIGTIAAEVNGDVEKIIVTGDLDTLQLVNDHVKVYTMKRGLTDSMIYDEQAVRQRYGLNPNQMIDYKALRGDPSDNIPGVRGIGEKTAIELLQNFKTLEGVYENTKTQKHKNTKTQNIYEIKPRIADLLKQYKDDAFMSKSLATIKCDVKIKFDLEKSRFNNVNQEQAVKLFSELEFKSLLPRVKEIETQKHKNTKTQKQNIESNKFQRNKRMFKYFLIDNNKEFDKFLLKLKKQKEFAFDTETANRDSINAELLGISFSWKEGEAYYVKHKNTKTQKHKNNNLFNYKSGIRNQELGIRNDWIEKLKPILEDEKIKKIGHNIKFDIKVMACYGIYMKGAEFDTMIASYLLNPGTRQHNLDALTFTELGHQKISKKDLLGSGREKKEFSEVSTEKLYNYSCEDADFTYRLAKKLLPELKKQKLHKLFTEIEMPLVLVLAGMEMSGIMLDNKFLADLSKKINDKINQLTIEIYQQANSEFNINSTQQLREVLFEKLEIPADNIAKNKTGLSTGADELAKLKDFHPIIKLIQEYRELNKLATTYIDALPKLVNPKTGRLHTSFNQSVTATGRLSSTEPNLQNIPIRTELGREIRKAFIADKGHKLLSLDYSQIELRLAAHMSGDEKMIKAFKDGADIHQITAAEINQVPLEDATSEMRRQAKAINFGILYGQGPHGLAQSADIPYARAKEFIDQYFAVYTGVKKYIDKTIDDARQKGYTETLFNRRRYLQEMNSSMVQVRKAAERMAINTPIQGTAADMIKMAMIEIHGWLHSSRSSGTVEPHCNVKMLLQVHDELLFEVKDDKVEATVVKIKKIMENVIKLKVPVKVDVKVGGNWGEMEEVRS